MRPSQLLFALCLAATLFYLPPKAGEPMPISDVMMLVLAGATGGAIYWAIRNESGVFQLAWKAIRKR